MRFFALLLSAVVSEIRAIFGVLPLLRRPFWTAWALCFLPALVGLLPGALPVVAQLLVLIGLGVAGLFSGILAKHVRRRKWVAFPDGPEVVPYLPQFITLLAGPPYLLAMFVLFLRAAVAFPGVMPTAGLLDTFLLSIDNFIRTQIFFDAAECFHFRLGGRAAGLAGASLVFISRFLMDLVFIKLAVQILHAAYYRARGLGRGQDILFTLNQEIKAGDVPRVKDLSQQTGDSLRNAVDTLRGYWEEKDDRAAMAWRCLVTMRDYAVPYLQSRHRSATGTEREKIAAMINRLENAPAEVEKPAQTYPGRLLALMAWVVLGVVVSCLLTGVAAFAISVLMTALMSWMLVCSRGWIDRLVRRHLLLPSPPDRLARLQLCWALCLLPLLVISWARLFHLVADSFPGVFSGATSGDVNYPSTLVFVMENLLHTQIFVDTFEVYGIRIADIRQAGSLGGLLTFLLRLVLNLGFISVAVSFCMVWFNRGFRKFAVSPNAELALREEVAHCGPQAAMLVGYHRREVRGFFMEQMRRVNNEAMLVALAVSGFFKHARADWISSEQPEDLARTRMNLGVALQHQGQLDDAVAEYQAAREIQERLVREGRNDLRDYLAMTRMNLGNVYRQQGRLDGAVIEYQAARETYESLVSEGHEDHRNKLAATRMNLGLALADQGRLDEAIIEYQAARDTYEKMVSDGYVDLRDNLAATRMNLGNVLTDQGRLDEAIAEYQSSREIRKQLVGEGRDDILNYLAGTRLCLGNALRQQGRLDEAIAEQQAACEIRESLVREGRDDLRNNLAATRMSLGVALQYRGRFAEAIVEYQAVQVTYECLVREGRDDLRNSLAMTRMNLGNTFRHQSRLDEAYTEYRAACEIRERLIHEGRGELRNDLAGTRMNIGNVLADQGRLEDAIKEYHAAREIYALLVSEGRVDLRNYLAMTRLNLGIALYQQGRLDEAVVEYQAAQEIYERLVHEKQFQLVAVLAKCWSNTLQAATQISQLEAISVSRSAFSFLRELIPERGALTSEVLVAIEEFLHLAQKSNDCEDEVAALAVHYALPPSPAV